MRWIGADALRGQPTILAFEGGTGLVEHDHVARARLRLRSPKGRIRSGRRARNRNGEMAVDSFGAGRQPVRGREWIRLDRSVHA
jgi:hypothetical protein